ncbi:MFS transporter [Motiliproteus sp.]|uniref:MFS transporter n=1 Tax=Motiliproteus sp. TaxID=1898955 RepID=UPI003BA944B2
MSTSSPSLRSEAWPAQALLAVIAGLLILLLNMGVRQSMGLLLPDMQISYGWPMAELSFAFAVQNLVWGAVSPLAGLAAERYGTVRVLLAGTVLYAAGLALLAVSESPWLYQASNGILIGIGIGATTFPVVLAAVGRQVSERQRSFALGVVSAGGSLGQFLFALLTQWANSHFGWSEALWILAGCILLMALFSPWLKTAVLPAPPGTESRQRVHFDRRFVLLATGFFVCGYHVAFISVHLPNLVAVCGLTPDIAANSLALIGLINVAGTIFAGWLGGRYHKPYLLSWIYGLRGAIVLAFIWLPKTADSFYLFSAVMGVLWLSTVPLTSGTLAQFFGTARLASLFGLVMFSHQIGAFFGAWISGWLFDQTGNYDAVWLISALLGFLAAAVHLPIKPARSAQPVPA